ncbi:MAG: Ni/Fe hydrogenase subunit alpha [Candidatus Nezhaarchaeota archaeon]|nr:Ni/Fe hydrogenase subunit alpha [Candidatus Nezhaarchaeota archaeon]MCX8141410.1 Ni/Fe hydrogenase subunit alpha [Candidatus Nezhaarchaeota archaeon]MDW8049676.1 Ni/Fe hydrogenase subunit alpha [Nitrososphaerota archaeon]
MAKEIVVEHLARVEGHGTIRVLVEDRKVKDVKFEIYEGPRFIEKILVGRRCYEAPDIVARICSICPEPHQVAAVTAIEKALGVTISWQTKMLRELQLLADVISSHALHLYLLSLPDYLGYPDALSMIDKYGREVKLGLQLKRAGNLLKEVISGRPIHGCTVKPGGYTRIPPAEELENLIKPLEESMEGAKLAVKLFSSIDYPETPRHDNIFMAIDPGEHYGFMGDYVLTSTGERYPVDRYKELTNEVTVPHSSAKHSTYKGYPFMVGALPRMMLNKSKLKGQALDMLKDVESKLDAANPLTNNLAQALETVYAVERSIEIINELLSKGLKPEEPIVAKSRRGSGAGGVEAPRGTLYHYYELDDEGRIVKADIVTPTAQNVVNMEKYIRLSAERLLAKGEEKLEPLLEMIVRAYDPCISCSVHMVNVVRLR